MTSKTIRAFLDALDNNRLVYRLKNGDNEKVQSVQEFMDLYHRYGEGIFRIIQEVEDKNLPKEIWLEDSCKWARNQGLVFNDPNKDLRARHKYVLSSRVKLMIELAELEAQKDFWMSDYAGSPDDVFPEENRIKELRELLQ